MHLWMGEDERLAELDIKEIEALIEVFARSSLMEMTFERGGARLTLKRGRADELSSIVLPPAALPPRDARPPEATVSPTPALAREPPAAAPTSSAPTGYLVKSPIVGTFYRRAAPDAKSYVQVGDRVVSGDTLCVVEAMKVMNEIKAERAGRVTQIVAEDGQHVDFGQVLMIIDPTAPLPGS